MLRLALNLATDRAHPSEGTRAAAAGHVIEAFGHFVMGGNFVIGVIVFAILIIVNFVVITEGLGPHRRGRGALHARRHARQADGDRRRPLGRASSTGSRARAPQGLEDESSFYGAMDGASKFVRGDAIAALLITFINVDRAASSSASRSRGR
jgi:flagellar biosynthesis protein FlhA